MNLPLSAKTGPAAPSVEGRRMALRRMKLWALACLVAALAGLAGSLYMGAQGGWAWLKAFCEAAAVGALADWFAVVALFRRPLGLPIPHTALVPKNKARMADSLAHFVSHTFLSPQSLVEKLRGLNPAATLSHWLSQPDNLAHLTEVARRAALQGLAQLDKAPARQTVADLVLKQARAWNATATSASVLQLLTQGGHHQTLLDGGLARLKQALDSPETRQWLASRLLQHAQAEWPKLIAWVNSVYSVDKMAGSLSEALARQGVNELQAALVQPDHALRQRVDLELQGFIQRLGGDAAFADQVEALKQAWLASDAAQTWANGLWDQLRASLATDLARNDSVLLTELSRGVAAFAQQLAQDPRWADALNAKCETVAARAAAQWHSHLTQHIAQTIQSWDDRAWVDQLELAVGRDLQFIRLNGTAVGGLVGLILHAALQLLA